MPRIVIPISAVDPQYLSQLEYALTFASEDVVSYSINRTDLTIEAELKSDDARDEATQKIKELVQRYERREFGSVTAVHFRNDRELPVIDAWQGLLDRKWVSPVGEGHVVLRGLAAELVELLDAKIDRMFARAFDAEREFYPSTILCTTLDRVHHFTSFPEHIDFVSHLKPDLAVIDAFSKDCREGGWSAETHAGRMAP